MGVRRVGRGVWLGVRVRLRRKLSKRGRTRIFSSRSGIGGGVVAFRGGSFIFCDTPVFCLVFGLGWVACLPMLYACSFFRAAFLCMMCHRYRNTAPALWNEYLKFQARLRPFFLSVTEMKRMLWLVCRSSARSNNLVTAAAMNFRFIVVDTRRLKNNRTVQRSQ